MVTNWSVSELFWSHDLPFKARLSFIAGAFGNKNITSFLFVCFFKPFYRSHFLRAKKQTGNTHLHKPTAAVLILLWKSFQWRETFPTRTLQHWFHHDFLWKTAQEIWAQTSTFVVQVVEAGLLSSNLSILMMFLMLFTSHSQIRR